MNRRLLWVLALLAGTFILLLPYNLKKLQQARRDTADADAISLKLADKRQAKEGETNRAAQLEQNRLMAEQSPSDVDVRLKYAESLQAAGRPLDAEYQFSEASRLAPTRADIRLSLAQLFISLDYTDAAISEMEQASRLSPRDIKPILLLSYTLGRLGKLREAEQVLDPATAAQPDSTDLHIASSVIRLAASDYAGAQEQADAACRTSMGDPRAELNAAKVYQRRAMSSEAIAAVRKALAKDPLSSEGRVILAQLLSDSPSTRKEARRLLDEVLAQEPNNFGAHYSLAQLLLLDRNYDGAIAELESIRRIQPYFPGTVHLLAQTYVKSGRRAEAATLIADDRRHEAADTHLSHLQMRCALEPTDYASRLALAETYINRSKFGHALYELKAIPADNPLSARARALMEQAYVRSGRLVELDELRTGKKHTGARITLGGSVDAANAVARSIATQHIKVSTNPADADAWLQLGAALGRSGDYAQSIVALTRAVELAPKNPIAWQALARAQQMAGHRAEEIAATDQWISLSPADGRAYERRANAFLSAGWVADAVADARKAAELDPNSVPIKKILGRALFFQGDKAASTEVLQKAKALRPDDIEIDQEIAANYTLEAAYGKARECLTGILARSPGYVPALLLRGSTNDQDPAGDKLSAEHDFLAVLTAEPDNVSAHYSLGILYNKLHRLPDAARELEEAARLRPRYVDAMKSLSHVYMLEGKKAEARRLIVQYGPLEALQLDEHRLQNRMGHSPKDPTVRLDLGRFYAKAGRIEDAIAEFSRGLQLSPGNGELRTALNQAVSKRQ